MKVRRPPRKAPKSGVSQDHQSPKNRSQGTTGQGSGTILRRSLREEHRRGLRERIPGYFKLRRALRHVFDLAAQPGPVTYSNADIDRAFAEHEKRKGITLSKADRVLVLGSLPSRTRLRFACRVWDLGWTEKSV